jgi:hypothetical protein
LLIISAATKSNEREACIALFKTGDIAEFDLGQLIGDAACDTGGFLLAALEEFRAVEEALVTDLTE